MANLTTPASSTLFLQNCSTNKNQLKFVAGHGNFFKLQSSKELPRALSSKEQFKNSAEVKRISEICRYSSSSSADVAEKCEYLVRESGWGVRMMVKIGEELRSVAQVQAEAFHEPVALFNGIFFEFFKAEVLSALMYRARAPPDRYACLVAESVNELPKFQKSPAPEIVGVVDLTVQNDGDVLRHLDGAGEYAYLSGMAVLPEFRRKKVASALLRGCDAVSCMWGLSYLALRAYEDDTAARKLYSRAGYRVVSEDPSWIKFTGKRRRVLMIKKVKNT